MIRRRPRGETTLSKATYDHKRPRFDPPSPERLEAAIVAVPGVVGTGLFVGMADTVLVDRDGQVEELTRLPD